MERCIATMRRVCWLVLALLLSSALLSFAGVPGFLKNKMGTLNGQLFVHEKPLADAIVSFFDSKGGPPPVVGSTRRVPDMVARTDDQGRFSVKLLAGSYCMGSLIREKGNGAGPPRDGEEYFFIRDSAGNLRTLEVRAKAISEVGRVDGVVPGMFKEFDDFIVIRGTITDETGKVLPGVLVTLRESLASSRPRYISKRTATDGSFEMKVPPGQYYVMARESLQGGRPLTGSYIGTYGKSAPLVEATGQKGKDSSGGVSLGGGRQGGGGEAKVVGGSKGEIISGIDIQMFRIPDPGATRQRFEEAARSRVQQKAEDAKDDGH